MKANATYDNEKGISTLDETSIKNPQAVKFVRGYVKQSVRDLPFQKRLEIYSSVLHDLRLSILKKLKEPLSYSELESRLEPTPNPNTLTYHLKKLEGAGLIEKKKEFEEDTKRYSKYLLTSYGKEVLAVEDLTTLL